MQAQSGQPLHHFFIGTYTSGNSEGIYKTVLHADGTLAPVELAAKTTNPAFLAATENGQFLLAISEVSPENSAGMVKSYRINEEGLEPVSASLTGGSKLCFVGVNSNGNVLGASYSDGTISSFRIDKNGKLTDLIDMKQHTGSGITDRQKGPHAHSAWFDPENNNVIAVDLGTNDLWIYALDKTGKLHSADPPAVSMNPGAGPRHLDFHPNGKWIYVMNELDCTVSLVKRSGNDFYKLAASYTTLPADFKEKNTCADIHVSQDGRFVYASNRGHNSLAIFKINKKDGTLTPAGHASVRGKTPRNFSLSPCGKFVVVANQNTGNIVSLRRDALSGQLEFVDEISAPKPVCIRFY